MTLSRSLGAEKIAAPVRYQLRRRQEGKRTGAAGGRGFVWWLLIALVFVLVASACARISKPQGWATPKLADGVLYVSTNPGKMAALNAQDFSTKWVFPPDTDEGKKHELQAIYGAPVVEGGNVYFAGYNGSVYAVAAADGKLLWEFKTGGPIIGGLALAGGSLFVASDDGKVYGLDPANGSLKLGPLTVGDSVWTAPLVAGSTLYVAANNGKLLALDTSTLRPVWDVPFEADAGLITDPVLAGQDTILVGGIDQRLYAVDAKTGEMRWSFKADNWFWGRPLVDKNTVYVSNLDHNVYALDLATGKPAWPQPFATAATVRSSPLLAGDVLIVVDHDGNVYGVDPATGASKWAGPTLIGKTVTADPLLFDKEVLVLVEGGSIYRIDPSGGSSPSLVQVKP